MLKKSLQPHTIPS